MSLSSPQSAVLTDELMDDWNLRDPEVTVLIASCQLGVC